MSEFIHFTFDFMKINSFIKINIRFRLFYFNLKTTFYLIKL